MKTVELDGTQYQVPDDASLDEIDNYIKSKGGGGQSAAPDATMTKTAAPATRPMGSRVGENVQDIATSMGAGPNISAALATIASLPQSIGQAVLPGVLPTVGAIGGGAIGTAVGGPAGFYPGAMAGGGGGEALNQQLGITEPSNTMIGVNAALPLAPAVIAGGQAGLRWLAPKLAGAQVVLRRIGIETAKALPASLRPPVASSGLFEELDKINPQIPLQAIQSAARSIKNSPSLLNKAGGEAGTALAVDNTALKGQLATVEQGLAKRSTPVGAENAVAKAAQLKSQIGVAGESIPGQASSTATDPLASVRSMARTLEQVVSDVPGANSKNFQAIRATMVDLNALIDSSKANKGSDFRGLMTLKRGFWQALESAAEKGTTAPYQKLKEVNKVFRQELAADEVDDIVFKNFGQVLEATPEFSSSAAQAHRQLSKAVRDDKFLADSFGPGDLKRTLDTFEEISNLPLRPAPKSANIGSGAFWRNQTMVAGIGELVGRYIGLPPSVGGITASTTNLLGAKIISATVQSKEGSKLLVKALKADPSKVLDAQWIGALTTFLGAQAAERPEVTTAVQDALKDAGVSLQDKIAASNSIFQQQKVAEAARQQLAK